MSMLTVIDRVVVLLRKTLLFFLHLKDLFAHLEDFVVLLVLEILFLLGFVVLVILFILFKRRRTHIVLANEAVLLELFLLLIKVGLVLLEKLLLLALILL